ncbi:DUF362 domain-containing protein [Candidatus Woesearchaeota archaeon]|nr:DUF362 domain-containing protein [Candidatus Woesearchaeota archaeon]
MQQLKLIKDLDKLEETLREQIKNIFSKGERIAVKVHMGEARNQYYIKAPIIKRIVNVLEELGLKPFLFDSIVLYRGERDTVEKYYKTAEMHGFTEEKIGCPIVISDKGIDIKTKDMTVHVCKELTDIDSMLVVSHVKGHCCYGFGGAIKNLGMGGVTPESKKDIHNGGQAETDDLLAQSAQAVLSGFKKVFYINFLIDIAKNCDCANDAGPIVADNIGILFGIDIVAIDKASVDLVYKQKSGVFEKLHDHDPYLQIKYSKELGLGEEEYDIS